MREIWRMVVACACLGWLVVSTRCQAQAARCREPRLQVEAPLGDAWLAATAALDAFVQDQAVEGGCALVRVLGVPGAVFLQVDLPDGRSAVRRIAVPALLVPAAAALLTPLPPEESVPEAAGADAGPPQSAKAAPRTEAGEPSAQANLKFNPMHLGFEFGVGASMHLAGRPRYLGYGLAAYVQVSVDAWLLGAWSRWDFRDTPLGQRDLPPDLDMASFVLGAYVGRRVSLRRCIVDGVLGPNVTVENQEAQKGSGEVGGAFADVSLSATLRVRSRWAKWRWPNAFGSLAGEVYPRRLGGAVHHAPELPALPGWGGTVALGAAWSPL